MRTFVGWMFQVLASLIYLLTMVVLGVPVFIVNAIWHAVLDIWDVCEELLITSARIRFKR